MLPHTSQSRVKTPAEAAVLADEYVLIHKNNFSSQGTDKVYRDTFSHVAPGSGFHRHKVDHEVTPRKQDNSMGVCHYCKGNGHWKRECPVPVL